MSFDATTEQDAILARLRANTPTATGGGYDSLPEEQRLLKDAAGILILPYFILGFGSLFPVANDRSIEGAEQQPFYMPIIVECWAARAGEARKVAGEVRTAMVGWAPSADNASEIDLQGGGWFDKRDATGRPIRFMESVTALTSVNNSVVIS